MKRISIKSYIGALVGGKSYQVTKFFRRVLSTHKFCLLFNFAIIHKPELQKKKKVDYWFFDPFFQQQLALNSGDVLTASETSVLNTSRTNNPAFSVWRS